MPRTSLDGAVQAFSRIAPRLVRAERETLSALPHRGEPVDIPWGEDTVTAYVHRAAADKAPCVFELHGGGFALGTALRDDAVCAAFAQETGACVIGVDYPKSPTYRYPAALDAAAAVIRYFARHADAYGLDPDRFAVLGFSAGGNLAAVLAAERNARGLPLMAQMLYYPYLDLLTDEDEKPLTGCDMPADQMRVFRRMYCDGAQWGEPGVSPALAAEAYYRDAPPAFVLLAERDALYPEGQRYAGMLKKAGVSVNVCTAAGMHHGFMEDAYAPAEACLRMDADMTGFDPRYREAAALAVTAGAAFFTGITRRKPE